MFDSDGSGVRGWTLIIMLLTTLTTMVLVLAVVVIGFLIVFVLPRAHQNSELLTDWRRLMVAYWVVRVGQATLWFCVAVWLLGVMYWGVGWSWATLWLPALLATTAFFLRWPPELTDRMTMLRARQAAPWDAV